MLLEGESHAERIEVTQGSGLALFTKQRALKISLNLNYNVTTTWLIYLVPLTISIFNLPT